MIATAQNVDLEAAETERSSRPSDGREIRIVYSIGEQTGKQLQQLDCPACSQPALAWGWKFEQPEFRMGSLVCQACDFVMDVTPARRTP